MNNLGPENRNIDYGQYAVPNPLYVDPFLANPMYVDKLQENFPALKDYHVQDKTLNAEHLSSYGNQDSFQTDTENSVRFVLKELKEAMAKNGMNPEWFNEFLINLGKRRHEIAIHSGRKEAIERFGTPRNTKGVLLTPLADNYHSYLEKFKKYNTESFRGNLIIDNYNNIRLHIPGEGEKAFTLSYVGLIHPELRLCMPAPELTEESYICNQYRYFWKNDDPVFKHTCDSFKEIIENDFLKVEELKDKIADFHWLFANISPFERGSSWCGEVLTDACWLFKGYVPVPIEHGKSLDLEAMSSNMQDFREIYPMAREV